MVRYWRGQEYLLLSNAPHFEQSSEWNITITEFPEIFTKSCGEFGYKAAYKVAQIAPILSTPACDLRGLFASKSSKYNHDRYHLLPIFPSMSVFAKLPKCDGNHVVADMWEKSPSAACIVRP